jgi:hypothetical protein
MGCLSCGAVPDEARAEPPMEKALLREMGTAVGLPEAERELGGASA